MKATRIDYIILDFLKELRDEVSAKSIYELDLMDELGKSRSTILKSLHSLLQEGLIETGAKDGKIYTYYITDRGLKRLQTLKED